MNLERGNVEKIKLLKDFSELSYLSERDKLERKLMDSKQSFLKWWNASFSRKENIVKSQPYGFRVSSFNRPTVSEEWDSI